MDGCLMISNRLVICMNFTCLLPIVYKQGRIISQCDNSSLHLFVTEDSGKWTLEEVKSFTFGEMPKGITKCCLHSSGGRLLFGTSNGNVCSLDVKSFEVTTVFNQEEVVQLVPEYCAESPDSVVDIAEHPLKSDTILIGYKSGAVVLWDTKTRIPKYSYRCDQALESLCWHRSGLKFISSHADGSYILWKSWDIVKPTQSPIIPYGPFPCKAITKIVWRAAKKGSDFKIFAGGMPRASYGDKHTISVMSGDKHQVLDFTSGVVDFFTICHADEERKKGRSRRLRWYDNPHALVVLTEEELVMIDLESDDWLPFRLPYLCSPHVSPITCTQHYSDVPQNLWNEIITAGNKSVHGKYTAKEWPIKGGKSLLEDSSTRDLLLTGHEDGSVRFWNASGVAFSHLYTINTSNLFVSESPVEERGFPSMPFRKVGSFDPYTDDPRLAVSKILLCVHSKTLVVAGAAGQIVFFEMTENTSEQKLEAFSVNIVSDQDNFVWKGHDLLSLKKTESLKFEPGFVPFCVQQLSPPAAVTTLSAHTVWGLVAAGTAHGFALFDFIQKKSVMTECTINTNESPVHRKKSFRKSLRKSYRRLLRKPSVAGRKKTFEKSSDDIMGSMVRCLYMAQSFIVDDAEQSYALWVGTNDGSVYVYTISIGIDNRKLKPVTCQLVRNFQMKHRSPVIAFQIVDRWFDPLPEPHEEKEEPTDGADRVIICTEEQFKMFTLPSMKPCSKYKLTEHDGSRARKVTIIQMRIDFHEGYFMACLSNEGEISIFSISDLRREERHNCVKRGDKNGISSLVFTKTGQCFYLYSPSEFQQFTFSTKDILEVKCSLNLLSGEPEEDSSDPDFYCSLLKLLKRFFDRIGSLNEEEETIALLIFECALEALEDISDKDDVDGDDDDDVNFPEVFEVTERNLSRIIDALEESKGARENFSKLFPQWRSSRKSTISKLRELADSINADRHNCNIAKLTGSSAGVLGGIAFAISPVFPPAAIVGVAVTAASSATVVGTSITEMGLLQTKMKEAKQLLRRDKEQFKPMTQWLKQSQKVIDIMDEIIGYDAVRELWQGLKKFKDSLSSSKDEGYSSKLQQLLLHCIEGGMLEKVLFKMIPVVITFMSVIVLFRKDNGLLFNCVVLTHHTVVRLLHFLQLETTIGHILCKVGGKTVAHSTATAVGRGALAAVGIALDVTNIVFDSIDVHKGSISEHAVQLKDSADKLEKELKVLQEVYDALFP